jgi:hypothetical protein
MLFIDVINGDLAMAMRELWTVNAAVGDYASSLATSRKRCSFIWMLLADDSKEV